MHLYALHTGELIRVISTLHPRRPSAAAEAGDDVEGVAEGGEVRDIRFSNLSRDRERRGMIMARGSGLEEWNW